MCTPDLRIDRAVRRLLNRNTPVTLAKEERAYIVRSPDCRGQRYPLDVTTKPSPHSLKQYGKLEATLCVV
jgi:hypothetical protein